MVTYLMSTIKLNYFADELNFDAISCVKCKSIAYKLYLCELGHKYCADCFLDCNSLCLKCDGKSSLRKGDDQSLAKFVVICKSCDERTTYSKMEKHYEECSKVKISCTNCGFSVLRSENKRHIEELCHIRWELGCPFGCNTIGMSKDDLQKHRSDQFLFHLRITYSIIKHFGLEQIFKVTDNSDATKGNGNRITFRDDLDRDVTNDISEFQATIEEFVDLSKKLQLKQHEKKEQMRLLERFIDTCLLTSFDGFLLWILAEMEPINVIRRSSIFYTGKYGYKLQLFLRNNEKSDEQELYLQFLPNTYDPILHQSFHTSVAVEYKIDTKPPVSVSKQSKDLDRSIGENLIMAIPPGSLEWIKFGIDTSELDWSSVD